MGLSGLAGGASTLGRFVFLGKTRKCITELDDFVLVFFVDHSMFQGVSYMEWNS